MWQQLVPAHNSAEGRRLFLDRVLSRQLGGSPVFFVIVEVAERFVHAREFTEAHLTIIAQGVCPWSWTTPACVTFPGPPTLWVGWGA